MNCGRIPARLTLKAGPWPGPSHAKHSSHALGPPGPACESVHWLTAAAAPPAGRLLCRLCFCFFELTELCRTLLLST